MRVLLFLYSLCVIKCEFTLKYKYALFPATVKSVDYSICRVLLPCMHFHLTYKSKLALCSQYLIVSN